jgi:hypothetical protein
MACPFRPCGGQPRLAGARSPGPSLPRAWTSDRLLSWLPVATNRGSAPIGGWCVAVQHPLRDTKSARGLHSVSRGPTWTQALSRAAPPTTFDHCAPGLDPCSLTAGRSQDGTGGLTVTVLGEVVGGILLAPLPSASAPGRDGADVPAGGHDMPAAVWAGRLRMNLGVGSPDGGVPTVACSRVVLFGGAVDPTQGSPRVARRRSVIGRCRGLPDG